jgi:hypothetical protein
VNGWCGQVRSGARIAAKAIVLSAASNDAAIEIAVLLWEETGCRLSALSQDDDRGALRDRSRQDQGEEEVRWHLRDNTDLNPLDHLLHFARVEAG